MRPMKEYLALGSGADMAFGKDYLLLPNREQKDAAAAAFKHAKMLHFTCARIEKFMKVRGECSHTTLFETLNARRVGRTNFSNAVRELIDQGLLYVRQGDSGRKGGRKALILAWHTYVPDAVMPAAILEEVAASPSSQQLVASPKTVTLKETIDVAQSRPDIQPILPVGAQEPAIDIVNEVMKDIFSKPICAMKISLDKDPAACEDAQVAEFRRTELKEPASEPKPQKIRRSALLEGLSS
jgi:hypothetical protein